MLTRFTFITSQFLTKLGFRFDAQQNPAVLAMQEKIHELGSIEFKIEVHPEGSWSAESTNIDGIITGGASAKEINATIKDAIFTYFKIPPYLSSDNLLTAANEPVTVEQRVWATR